MTVREGNAPDQVDKDVAFRTTYYFRIFDYCVNKKRVNEYFEDMEGQVTADAGFTKLDNRLYTILNDSLYRFTMTGKASTLLTNIKFEAGTLSAAEIDPFGSQIIYDENLQRFRYSSSQELKQKAIAIEDYENLLKRQEIKRRNYEAEIQYLQKKLGDPEINKQENESTKNFYKDILVKLQEAHAKTFQQTSTDPQNGKATTVVDSKADNTLVEYLIKELEEIQDDTTLEKEKKLALEKTVMEAYKAAFVARLSPESDTINCPTDAPVRKGFQVLGPEGWKTFDQDERLIMAMYSSADPLISVMKDLSSRVLAARATQQPAELPFIKEKNRILEAQKVINAGIPVEETKTGFGKLFGDIEKVFESTKN